MKKIVLMFLCIAIAPIYFSQAMDDEKEFEGPPPKYSAQETQSSVPQEQNAESFCCICKKALKPVECFKLIPMGDEIACEACIRQRRENDPQLKTASTSDSSDDDSSSDDEQEVCDYCKELGAVNYHEKNIKVVGSVLQATFVWICDTCYDNRNNPKGYARRFKGFFKRRPQQ